MVFGLYTIYDRVAEQFGAVMTCKTEGVALRAFRNGLAEARREEFCLFKIGEFDDEKGKAFALDRPEEVIIPEEVK